MWKQRPFSWMYRACKLKYPMPAKTLCLKILIAKAKTNESKSYGDYLPSITITYELLQREGFELRRNIITSPDPAPVILNQVTRNEKPSRKMILGFNFSTTKRKPMCAYISIENNTPDAWFCKRGPDETRLNRLCN